MSQTKRQQQGKASREIILDAAQRLMAANGYDATSISALSKESGLPPSSIYWHFESKQGVLAAVMERGAKAFFAALLPAPGDGSSRKDVRDWLRVASKAISEQPEFLRLFLLLLLQEGQSLEHSNVINRVREEGRGIIVTVLRAQYAAHGDEAASDVAEQLADFAHGMFDGAFLAVQYNPKLSHLRLMEQMADALLALGDQIIARRELASPTSS